MKIACCILSYNITKGMKSFGPIGMLKKNKTSKELIIHQIEYLRKIFGTIDVYVITGFGKDKIDKKIAAKKYVHIIHNDQYLKKNYSYAFKLFLENIKSNLDNYHGVFFLDSNVLIRSLKNKKRNLSWLVTKPHKNNSKIADFLGVNLNEEKTIEHVFYNLGNISWCKSFYLTRQDIETIIDHRNSYHDNMFLFEILNRAVDDLGINVYTNSILSAKDLIEINGIKDKSKVK